MLRKVRTSLVIVLLMFHALSAGAESVDRIIRHHLKAVGGANRLQKIMSVYSEGHVTNLATGETGSFAQSAKAPGRLYTEMTWSGDRLLEGFNGKSAWRLDSAGGLRTLTGREAMCLEATALFRTDHFLRYKKEKTLARWIGNSTANHPPAQVIEFTSREGVKRRVFFDAKRYLILKEEQDDEGASEQISYRDYRSVDGVLEPFKLEIHRGEETLDVTLDRVTHNAPIPDSVFDFPRTSDAPLPDIADVLKDVQRNQKKIDELRDSYTYLERDLESALDKQGRIRVKSEETYEVFHLGGRMVRKLVKKNGRELTAEEQQAENARVEKTVRDYLKRRGKEAARQERERQKALEQGKDPQDEEQERRVSISTFLHVAQFTNPRRERLRGQEVIVFDFEPKPDYQARDRNERLLQKLVGVAWVDEQARQVARLEARFSDSFKLAAGLLSVQRGSAFVFEQKMVNNELWLPSYAEGHLSAKALFIAGLNLNFAHYYSDYKKFRVESLVKVGLP